MGYPRGGEVGGHAGLAAATLGRGDGRLGHEALALDPEDEELLAVAEMLVDQAVARGHSDLHDVLSFASYGALPAFDAESLAVQDGVGGLAARRLEDAAEGRADTPIDRAAASW